MAKRKKRKSRRGTGNVITTRRARQNTSGLGSLGSLKKPGSFAGAFLPPLIGGGLTALATVAVMKMGQEQQKQAQVIPGAQPQQVPGQSGVGYTRTHWHSRGVGAAGDQQQQTGTALVNWAPAIGVALGGVASFALYSMSGKHAGFGAAAGSIGVGGALLVYSVMNDKQQQTVQGVGAIVPEYGTNGLGAIVMEPESAQGYNAYSGGQDVSIRGLGSGLAGGLGAQMDVSAFGPASF